MHCRSFIFEFSDNFSVTNLFGNLCDRIDFLLPETFEKDPWKLHGKMYRSRQPSENNSICTLQDYSNATSSYLINGSEVIEADHLFDSIIGKLNLMYSTRQSYSIEGTIWKSKQNRKDLVKCATINSGSEAVNILIQAQSDEILKKIFPDLLDGSANEKVKLIEVTVDSKGYFAIIVKAIKLTI